MELNQIARFPRDFKQSPASRRRRPRPRPRARRPGDLPWQLNRPRIQPHRGLRPPCLPVTPDRTRLRSIALCCTPVAPNCSRSPRPCAPCLFCSLFPVPFLRLPQSRHPYITQTTHPAHTIKKLHQIGLRAPLRTPAHRNPNLDVWTFGIWTFALLGVSALHSAFRIPHSEIRIPTPRVHQICVRLWVFEGVDPRAPYPAPGSVTPCEWGSQHALPILVNWPTPLGRVC